MFPRKLQILSRTGLVALCALLVMFGLVGCDSTGGVEEENRAGDPCTSHEDCGTNAPACDPLSRVCVEHPRYCDEEGVCSEFPGVHRKVLSVESAGGVLWFLMDEPGSRIVSFDGLDWRHHSLPAGVGLDEEFVLEVGHDGRPWLASQAELFVMEDGEWRRVARLPEQAQGKEKKLQLVVDARGIPSVTYQATIPEWRFAQWIKGSWQPTRLTAGRPQLIGGDRTYVRTEEEVLVLADGELSPLVRVPDEESDFVSVFWGDGLVALSSKEWWRLSQNDTWESMASIPDRGFIEATLVNENGGLVTLSSPGVVETWLPHGRLEERLFQGLVPGYPKARIVEREPGDYWILHQRTVARISNGETLLPFVQHDSPLGLMASPNGDLAITSKYVWMNDAWHWEPGLTGRGSILTDDGTFWWTDCGLRGGCQSTLNKGSLDSTRTESWPVNWAPRFDGLIENEPCYVSVSNVVCFDGEDRRELELPGGFIWLRLAGSVVWGIHYAEDRSYLDKDVARYDLTTGEFQSWEFEPTNPSPSSCWFGAPSERFFHEVCSKNDGIEVHELDAETGRSSSEMVSCPQGSDRGLEWPDSAANDGGVLVGSPKGCLWWKSFETGEWQPIDAHRGAPIHLEPTEKGIWASGSYGNIVFVKNDGTVEDRAIASQTRPLHQPARNFIARTAWIARHGDEIWASDGSVFDPVDGYLRHQPMPVTHENGFGHTVKLKTPQSDSIWLEGIGFWEYSDSGWQRRAERELPSQEETTTWNLERGAEEWLLQIDSSEGQRRLEVPFSDVEHLELNAKEIWVSAGSDGLWRHRDSEWEQLLTQPVFYHLRDGDYVWLFVATGVARMQHP